jgi:AmiR/NasT family two-component response regulator
MVSAAKGKKVHDTPVALLYDEGSNPESYRAGLNEARLFNVAVAPLGNAVIDSKSRCDVNLVLISGWDPARAKLLRQLVDAQRQRGGIVLVVARHLDARSMIEALRLGVEAVLSADLPMRGLYRRITFHLQRMRARQTQSLAEAVAPSA